jgi:hypothetical protein
MKMTIGLVLLLPAALAADEVTLRGGGKVSGVIVERTATVVVLETGPGRVSVPLARIQSIRETASDLGAFNERAARLAHGDAKGWAELARWAADRDLATQSREAYEHVLALDPSQPEANRALGRVQLDGRWVTEAEANRARGLVPFEGGWVTPAERQSLIQERALESASARAAREAESRVREAEARAREAEARARAAETGAQSTNDSGTGLPLWPYVFGGGGLIVRPMVRSTPPPPPPPTTPPPAVRPPTASIGPTSKPTPQARSQGQAVDPGKP